MRHRDAGVGGRRHRGADAGHDLERDAGLRQRQRLLAAAAEHERVAALQPHHDAASPRLLDQPRVDLALRQTVGARALAREDAERARRRLVEQGRVDETVVDDHVGAAQHLETAHRHEPGIARSGTDQVDATRLDHADSRFRAKRARAWR